MVFYIVAWFIRSSTTKTVLNENLNSYERINNDFKWLLENEKLMAVNQAMLAVGIQVINFDKGLGHYCFIFCIVVTVDRESSVWIVVFGIVSFQ